jgi:hypothetical protein
VEDRYFGWQELTEKIVVLVKNAGDTGITRRQLCLALRRTKAPHIIAILEDLTTLGLFTRADLGRGLGHYYLYCYNHNTVAWGQWGTEVLDKA